MKKVYYSLLILFIVLLFVSPVILAEPNTDLNVLLYSEDKEDTATHLKLYASDEIIPNKSIIYSIVITASVPSPLGSGNVIDQGLVALVVPETAEVDYKNIIKVYGAPTPDSNKYVEYQPESELTKEWFNILGSIVSKIPFLGLVMDLAPLYQAKPGEHGEFINLNQYDIVKINWEAPRLKYWQKVQIDIPVHLGDDTGIGLYAYWQSRASSSDGTGPTFARNNVVDIGFNISEEKPVISEIGKIGWDKTYGGDVDDLAYSIIQTSDGGYAVAGCTASKGSGKFDIWIIKFNQSGNITKYKVIGGSADDKAYSIIQTSDGGYAVAGYTASKGEGGMDFCVIKLDEIFNVEWDQIYGGSADDKAYSIIQTSDGGYAVAGYTYSKGEGRKDVWVIKLDEKGIIVWDKTFGGSIDDEANSIIQVTDGHYVVIGYTYSKGLGAGACDAWVIKLDEIGGIEWDKTYGGSSSDAVYSIIQTSDDGYAVAGLTYSKGTGNQDAWIIKLDKKGYIDLDQNFGGDSDDLAYSIIQTSDGGYAVAGYTHSKGEGEKDIWVIKIDEKGIIVWDKTFGGSSDDEAKSIIQTTDGGYAVAGYTSSEGEGARDIWVIKLDGKGNLESTADKETIYEKTEP